jgi:hypothetical protein
MLHQLPYQIHELLHQLYLPAVVCSRAKLLYQLHLLKLLYQLLMQLTWSRHSAPSCCCTLLAGQAAIHAMRSVHDVGWAKLPHRLLYQLL